MHAFSPAWTLYDAVLLGAKNIEHKWLICGIMREILWELDKPIEAEPDITFEQLEINTIFLDEAHNYKNLTLDTKMKNIRGINIKGSAKCTDMLAVAYFQGRGIDHDERLCLFWCEKAAELGNVRAMGLAANIYGNESSPNYNKQKSIEYLKKASDAGHPASMVNLGQKYMHGDDGFPVDYDKAEELFSKAAKAGLSQANLFLRALSELRREKSSQSSSNINSSASSSPSSSSGGCYIATCVYGSYDCPEVWTLRRFRDNELALTWYGRAFIKMYYAISPTLVRWFGETKWFKNMWRGTLNNMVDNLRRKGYESTPYKDTKW